MKSRRKFLGVVLLVTILFVFSFATVAAAATKTGDDDYSSVVKFGDIKHVVTWSVYYEGEYVPGERVEYHNVSGCMNDLPYNYTPYCNASCHYKEDGEIIHTIGANDWSEQPALCNDHPYNYEKVKNVYYNSSDFYADILTIIDTVGGDSNPFGTLQVYY